MNKKFLDKKSRYLPIYAAVYFTVIIAVVGAFMMTIGSSPQMKGAVLLWIPAALQLIAGVWLGPRLGLISGGLGAYGAGIIAYGGWGLVDIIMNPIAGGFANAMLPALLFRYFKINPTFNANPSDMKKAIISIISLLVMVLIIGVTPLFIPAIGKFGYLIAILVLIIGAPVLLKNINLNKKDFLLAVTIVIFISFISAIIGTFGVVTAGNSIEGAILGTGIGWFLGDTISALLGLYILIYFTNVAVSRGYVHIYWK